MVGRILLHLFRSPSLDINGKVIWITGASSGIGRALALEIASLGGKLILSSRNSQKLQQVHKECMQNNGNVEENICILPLDLSEVALSREKRAMYVKQALQFYDGRVDVLINNAGISLRARVEDTDLKVDMDMMNINYFGTIALTKEILPSMLLHKSGHIVVMNSLQGKFGIGERAAYSATKHALMGFFDSLRIEVEERGISVLMVCPGYVKTNLSLNALTGDGSKYAIMDDNTAKGYSSHLVAKQTIEALCNGDKEIFIAKLLHKIAAKYGKALFPGLLHRYLVRRNNNNNKKKK